MKTFKKEILEITKILNDKKLTKIHVKNGSDEITVEKKVGNIISHTSQPGIPVSQNIAGLNSNAEKFLSSKLVGTFYLKPDPTHKDFVKPGDKVKEGQTVRAGQAIAVVDASVIASNVDELKTRLEYAEYMLGKQEELNKRGVGSEVELETAKNQVESLKASIKSLNTQRGKAVIKAPFTGVVDNIFARNGQMAGPTSPIIRLVNNNSVDIVAQISEKHLANVRVGTPITVSFPNYKDTTVELTVTNVGNYIEPTNRTFRITAAIKKNTVLLPNMLAELSITDLAVEDGLVIPAQSIMKDQDNFDFIFVAEKSSEGENTFKISKMKVTVIKKSNGEALIQPSKSLKKGVKVVVEGAKGVTDQDIVRIQ